MAFGIDDALTAAVGGVKLVDTITRIIKRYQKEKKDVDLGLLIEEIRVEALRRIEHADLSLMQLERMVRENGVDTDMPLGAIIEKCPFWRPFQSIRLKRIHKSFESLSDNIYSATDDIAALVRCNRTEQQMGIATIESYKAKNELIERLKETSSFSGQVKILRDELE